MAVDLLTQRPPLQTAQNPLQEKKKIIYNDFGDKVATGWDKSGQPVYGDNNGGASGKADVNGGGNNTNSGNGGGTQTTTTAAPVQRANAFANFKPIQGQPISGRSVNVSPEQMRGSKLHPFVNDKGEQKIVQGAEGFMSPIKTNVTVNAPDKLTRPVTTSEPVDNRSEFQKFRDSLYDEDKIRRKSDIQAKTLAFGEALRNLGHLWTVGEKGASPQKFSYDAASAERDRYETGRQNRDAMAYKMYQADLAQKAQEAERQRKDLLAQSTMAKDKSTMQYNEARTNKTLQDIGIQAQKYPYELQELAGKAAQAHANGQKAVYEAYIKELEAKNTPEALRLANEVKKSTITKNYQQGSAAVINANAHMKDANTRASESKYNIEYKKAQIEKIKKGDSFELPSGSKNKNWVIDKNNSKNVESTLKSFAKKKGWADEDSDDNALLVAAFDHLDDPELNREIAKYAHGKDTDNNNPYSGDDWK